MFKCLGKLFHCVLLTLCWEHYFHIVKREMHPPPKKNKKNTHTQKTKQTNKQTKNKQETNKQETNKKQTYKNKQTKTKNPNKKPKQTNKRYVNWIPESENPILSGTNGLPITMFDLLTIGMILQ